MLTTSPRLTEDEAALLIERHQREVWRYLVALGCDSGEAEDLTQETFLALLRSDFLLRDIRQTRSYLRKIAKHLLIDLRRRKCEPLSLADVEVTWEPLVGEEAGDEIVQSMKECLKKLNDRAAEALRLTYECGLTHAQCGDVLGLKEEAVRSLIRRTREKLRDCVKRRTDGKRQFNL